MQMYFTSADEFHATLGAFLIDVMQQPDLARAFSANRALIRVDFTEPEAVLWIDCRSNPPHVSSGADSYSEAADLSLSMTADNGHRFWLGKLSLPVALTSRKVRAKGPINVLIKLLPALKPAFREYEQFLLARERRDLVEV